MRRREFIALVGGATVWPLAARAQQPAIPVIGFMHPSTAERNQEVIAAFEEGLRNVGYVAGRNVKIEYRWANDNYDRLPELAQDLVKGKASVILAATPVAALAAKRATDSIPIVFTIGSDPVKDGLVASLGRPGGNITGTTFFADLLSAKRLELLRVLMPNSTVFGVLVNPKNANAELETNDANQAARSMGAQTVLLSATTEPEISESFLQLRQQHTDALLIASDAFLNLHADQITKLAIENNVPTCFSFREPVLLGGLMSYGASRPDSYRRAANYVGRILNGEKAADLPVQQPTKFEFVLNLKTAKGLGLTIPHSVQLLADEVIE